MNFPFREKKRKTTYTRTGRKLPQNYDITSACDLMEFPLTALARKIYFLLKAWRSRWPPFLARQINKSQNFYS